jgi:hypothetical protein
MGLPKFRISESAIKRYIKAKGMQSKGAACIICGKNFDDCPHSFVDFDMAASAINVSLMLGIRHP